ncbi:MAG TPA: DMT family transporter [Blastocatellia bacterium]|nr:DMT family transporter [Blastocatellia bacterium]
MDGNHPKDVIEEDTKAEQPDTGRVMAAMGFAVLALAFASIFITQLERDQIPASVIAFYRMAIATVLLLPVAVAFRWREIASLKRRDFAMLALGGGCLALHFAAWTTSLKYIPIATSVIVVNSHPLFVVLASYLFLGEPPQRRSVIGAGAGLAGMLVISRESLGNLQFAGRGVGLALLGALAVVGYFIVGRKLRSRMSLIGYVVPLYAICSLLLLAWALAGGVRLAPFRCSVWGSLVALALVPTIIGHSVFNWAVKHVRPTAISVAFLGEPVLAGVLAFVFFAQRPPIETFIGGVLVLAGVYMTTSK